MIKNKIIHLITSLGDGGAEGVLFRLIKSTKKNYNHYVICLGAKDKYFYKFKKININVICLDINFFNLTKKIIFLFHLIKKHNPNYFQTWLYHGDLIGGLVAKFAGVNNIIWNIRTSEIKIKNNKLTTLVVIFLCSILSYFIPKVIVSCSKRGSLIHKKVGYNKKIFKIIHNGFQVKNSNYQTKYYKPIFVIGMVARYHSVKNHKLLFEALQLFKKRNIKFKFLLIGTGINKNNFDLIKNIKKYQLEKNVVLKDRVNNVSDYFKKMDIHILPSLSEGFPNVVAESMLNFTPCIATDVGETGKIIFNKVLLVKKMNPFVLENKIYYCYKLKSSNPKKWNLLRKNCFKMIKNNFSLEKMLIKYTNIWSI